jgi:uncharacterized protein (TIGR02466 family)
MSQPRVLKLFSAPVIVDRLDAAETLNSALEHSIAERRLTDPGVVRSNVGGWHSKSDLFSWAGDAGRTILRHALGLANANTTDPSGKPVSLRWRCDAWANVSEGGHSNAAHVHGGAYWSAVYYVRVGDGVGGHLLLHDPRMPGLRMHAPGLRLRHGGPELVARLKPVPGQMILFPSWLSHSVEPWDGSEPRVSIALNLSAPVAQPRRLPPRAPATPAEDPA